MQTGRSARSATATRCNCGKPPPSDATSANLVVLSSKGQPECQISLTVQVQLTDLQEMQNHMRETIDQGLKDLQEKQGKGGLPAAPPSAQAPPVEAQYASAAPPPEANLATDIQQADQQGAQAEKDVTSEAAQDSGAPGGAARLHRRLQHRSIWARPSTRCRRLSARRLVWRIWDPRSSITTAAA